MFNKFQPIASALSPNLTLADIFISARFLFLPCNWTKWQKGKNTRRLERKFNEYLRVRWAVSFESGRAGLHAILKCLNIKEGDEVIIPAFTTVALPNVIKWLGAKPIYIDIEENTYNANPDLIESKITEKTKAIIVQHTFGNPAKLDEIMKIAKQRDLYLIEDCAHSLGGEYQNKKLGTFGDVAFFSLGRDKIISSVSGGMVVTNNKELGRKIKEFKSGLPYPDLAIVRKQLLHPLITFIALKTYYLFGMGKIIMFLSQRVGLLSKAYSEKEKKSKMPENFPARMPNALAAIALHQFKLIDKFNNYRMEIARRYQKLLSGSDKIIFPQSTPNSKNIFLWYTIRVKNKKELLKQARRKHILLGDWFPQAVGPVEVDLKKVDYKIGDCPVAEKVSRECVNLPTHYKIKEKDILRVVEIVLSEV